MSDESYAESDAIRILIATDSHVGYAERDPIRKDDSWQSFHEAMCIAKERDVDMILLAGDLFHDNKPSRQAMYQVMRSLRMNCLGEKPCELEMLSDKTECFEGVFNHVNYEDPDINVAIPVFSIHGNHDDPTGDSHLASLDLLQITGLVNYYGRTHESDNINIKPVLLQKGRTKLALYGMSNVRDERLFRTFRDGKVKFFRPATQSDDWFNIMSVHQNRHAYTETNYLPESFLPAFMDLVLWGHEHECLINPRLNPEMGFHVIQPGSSVATSLIPGEAVAKHVAILTVCGRDFKVEPIRLKTVRPYVYRDFVLSEDKVTKKLARKENNRTELTKRLTEVVEELIDEAKAEWLEAQDESQEEIEVPLPLIRLRVEYSAPDGGSFDCENPQRFSNRFVGRVANVNDVVQFHRKKSSARKVQAAELPQESVLAQMNLDHLKVDKLVKEFLTAQNLTILPQNSFGDAVSQFVDKDDKHAMEVFVNESLQSQIGHLLELEHDEEADLEGELEAYKSKLEELFQAGHLKRAKKGRLKPKPDNWDTDLDGNWSDQPGALERSDGELNDEASDDSAAVAPARPTRGRGRGRGRGGTTRGGAATTNRKATAATRKTSAAAKPPPKAAPKPTTRSRKKTTPAESEEEEILDDAEMLDDSESQSQLFIQDSQPAPPPVTRSRRAAASSASAQGSQGGRLTQSTLKFSTTSGPSQGGTSGRTGTGVGVGGGRGERASAAIELSSAESSEDSEEDAFEPVVSSLRSRRR